MYIADMFSGGYKLRFGRLLTIACMVAIVMPLFTQANSYSQNNFLSLYQHKPTSFSAVSTGGFVGTLENGESFTQVPILTHQSHRIHKFSTQESHFYISDQGTFIASSDLVALSIYSYLLAA